MIVNHRPIRRLAAVLAALLLPIACTGVITGAEETATGEIEGTDAGPDTPPDAGPSFADAPPSCGDRICGEGEHCQNCAIDCGECPPSCGDGVCDPVEDCRICPVDCGDCPPAPDSWSFLVISDTRSDMDTWGTALAMVLAEWARYECCGFSFAPDTEDMIEKALVRIAKVGAHDPATGALYGIVSEEQPVAVLLESEILKIAGEDREAWDKIMDYLYSRSDD